MTNPKDISQTLHLIRAGLHNELLTKEEVIAWADKIIMKDESPDIFFIDISLLVSKSKDDLIYYINDYLNLENKMVPGRPLFGLLYKKYITGQINLVQTIANLFMIIDEADITEKEMYCVYQFDIDYDSTWNNYYGPEAVEIEVKKFLTFYKDYSLDNFENLEDLNLKVDIELEKDSIIRKELYMQQQKNVVEYKKSWWKFW